MRERVASISTTQPGQRLPVPGRRDELSGLEETLNEMLARPEQGLERERAFVADASHQLRTPLALLKTEIELALLGPSRSAEELRQAPRSAGEETDRLTQLAEDLLLLASVDKNVLPIRREPVEVVDLLTTTALRFERRGLDSGRRIIPELDSDVSLLADRGRLEQALGNLVENALRHGAGSIRVFALAHDGQLALQVSDEGQGFPDPFIGHAFQRFTRADEARSHGVTGLDLAIVAAIAQAHEGRARAANLAGSGADVWLSLPIASGKYQSAGGSALSTQASG